MHEHTLYYTFQNTGEMKISTNKLIYREKDEIVHDLMEAGFRVLYIYGGWDSRDYSDNCEEMIFLAKKL